MKKSAVVLLSSGLDSTVNFHMALKDLTIKLAVTFNYGQRAATKEIEKATLLCREFSVPHKVLNVEWVKLFGNSALIDEKIQMPVQNQVQIDSYEVSMETMKSVWVPNRNGILLNIAAGFAESLQADYVIPGFNREEAATFPDNSFDYMKALNNSFKFSTRNEVQVKCYTVDMDKTQIAKNAVSLGVNWNYVWPCYFSREKWCGQCESCQRSHRALLSAGVDFNRYFEGL